MFIGVVQGIGTVRETAPNLLIEIDASVAADIEVGSHIAANGRVLRVLSKDTHLDKSGRKCSQLKFYASNMNHAKGYSQDGNVNIEKAVRLGDEIPGVFFYGIPTAQCAIVSMESMQEKLLMKVSFESDIADYLSVMDQVCIDGALMQVFDVDKRIFSFNIYSSTLESTNLRDRRLGDNLNFEVDPFTLKIARVLKKMQR